MGQKNILATSDVSVSFICIKFNLLIYANLGLFAAETMGMKL